MGRRFGSAAWVLFVCAAKNRYSDGQELGEDHIMKQLLCGCAVILILGAGGAARAAIIGTSGAVVMIAPPPSVRTSMLESDTEIRAFNEQQNITLNTNISADITVPGVSPSASSQNFSPGMIASGTKVSSYLAHFDAVGNRTSNPAPLSGSITFDTDVIGLIVLSQAQNNTDAYPGLTSVSYPQQEPSRGLEIVVGGVGQDSNDEITLSADRRTVFLNLRTGMVQDEVRIITAAPEPGGALLASIAALRMVGRRGRRKWVNPG
jgi:hypothetical protein